MKQTIATIDPCKHEGEIEIKDSVQTISVVNEPGPSRGQIWVDMI